MTNFAFQVIQRNYTHIDSNSILRRHAANIPKLVIFSRITWQKITIKPVYSNLTIFFAYIKPEFKNTEPDYAPKNIANLYPTHEKYGYGL